MQKGAQNFWREICSIVLPNWSIFAKNKTIRDITHLICVGPLFKQPDEYWFDHFDFVTPVQWTEFKRVETDRWKSGKRFYTDEDVRRRISKSRQTLIPTTDPQPFDGISSFGYVIPVFVNKISSLKLGPQKMAQLYAAKLGGVLMAFSMRWGKGALGFTVIPSWPYFKNTILDGTPPTQRHFYENITAEQRVSFYMDFDGDYDQLLEMPRSELIDSLFECIGNALENTVKVTRKNVFVFDSSNEHKVSLHLVGGPSFPMWENARALCSFMVIVRAHVFAKLFGTMPDEMRHKLVDLSVYDLNSKFRLPGCSKVEKVPRPKRILPEQEKYVESYRDMVVGK